MSRVLITTVPAAGHVRPTAPIARALVQAGHDVVWYGGEQYRSLIERSGARLLPVTADLPFDPDGDALAGTDGDRPPGIGGLRRVIHDVFVAPIPAYVADLGPKIDDLAPDVVLTDHSFMASPIVARRRGIPVVVFSLGPLAVSSVDTAPFGLGLPPSSSPLGRLRNRLLAALVQGVVLGNCQAAARRVVAELGEGPFPGFFTDWSLYLADRYMQAGVPEIEYPRSDLPAQIDFIGITDQRGVDDWTPPAWWGEVEEARRTGRKVVVTTQGSAATRHDQLLLPAIEALAGEDVLHIATTVTREPADVLPAGERPANLRLERFVPFTELLPLADVLVTNGGYGGVQTSLSYGVPLVVAGMTEDKMESNARLAWSGAGVSLRSNSPSPDRLRRAVRQVLGDERFTQRARHIGTVYQGYGGTARAAEIVAEAAGAATVRTER